MDPLTHPTVRRVLERARRDPDVLAVMLFGSHARSEASAASDVDLCLVLASETLTNLEMSRRRLAYLAGGADDLVIFQQLPLAVRSRVLKEGKVLFVRDEDPVRRGDPRRARLRGLPSPPPRVSRRDRPWLTVTECSRRSIS